jgi:hypothetical protein
MIVVMKRGATQGQVVDVMGRIEQLGCRTFHRERSARSLASSPLYGRLIANRLNRWAAHWPEPL